MIKAGEYIEKEVADVIRTLKGTAGRGSQNSLITHLSEVRRQTGKDLSKAGLTHVLQGDYKVTEHTKPILEALYKRGCELKERVA